MKTFSIANKIALCCLLLFVGSISNVFAQDKIEQELNIPPVRLACTSLPPYKIEGNVSHPGMDVEVIEEALDLIGIPHNRVFAPWKRTYEGVLAGNYDALCGCSYRKDREEFFYFSSPVGQIDTVFFTLTDKHWNVDLENMPEGKVIGVVRGYSLEAELVDRGVGYQPAKDEKQLLDLLVGGRVDAIYSFKAPVEWHMKSMTMKPELTITPVRSTHNFVCFRKKHPGVPYFLTAFNQALMYLKTSGRTEEIRAGYR